MMPTAKAQHAIYYSDGEAKVVGVSLKKEINTPD
jgi:hypothetical protein